MKKTGNNSYRISRILASVMTFLFVMLTAGCSNVKTTGDDYLPENKKLIVYTSHKPEIYEPIIKEFEERSGIWVSVVTGGTNELLDDIAINGEYGCADVMFGGGADSLVMYEDYFERYRSVQYENLDREYGSKNDAYTVFSKLPIVFIYNEKLVISAGTPRSFEELLSSRWEGHIAFASPTQSGSSYTALATMIQVLSQKYSKEEIIRAFAKNLDGDICESSGAVLDKVIAGEKLIGITLEETALKRIDEGAEIGIVYPQDGTSMVPDGCAILKNAPHRSNAELFLEFMVSDDVQRLLTEELFRRSVRVDMVDDSSIVAMDYDIEYAIKNRSSILDFWNISLEKEISE